MASKYWIKLWIEILEDSKMGPLPDNLWRRAIELFLLAGEVDAGGELPDVAAIAWKLRHDSVTIRDEMLQLCVTGILIQLDNDHFIVTNFAERQKAVGDKERKQYQRKRETSPKWGNLAQNTPISSQSSHEVSHENVTKRDIDTDTDTENKSAAEKRRPPAVLAYKIFVEETKKNCLNMPQIKAINEVVGDDPAALDKWREVVKAWNLNGNKLTDAAGMLDWFKTGKRSNYDPNKFKNGNGPAEPTIPTAPPLDDAKRQAYAAMLAADRQAAAESAARVGEIMAAPTAGGVDVERALRRVAKGMKK